MKHRRSLTLMQIVFVLSVTTVYAQTQPCFSSPSDNIIPTGSGTTSVTVANLNSDEHPDIVSVNNESGTVTLLTGNGDRSFAPAETVREIAKAYVVLSEDFNSDNKADLAVLTTDGKLSLLMGDGTAHFSQGQTHSVFPGSATDLVMKAADFNADDKPDIIIGTYNYLAVLYGDGAGEFGTPVKPTPQNGAVSIACADFTGDEITDVAYSYLGKLHILVSNGVNGFSDQTLSNNSETFLVNGDFNNDGHQDIVFPRLGKLLLGNGTGAFPTAFDVDPVKGFGSILAAKLNDDDLLDVAIINNGGVVSVHYATSGTSFANHINYLVGTYPADVVANDLDGDGHIDLILAERKVIGGVSVLYNEGNSFSTSEAYHDRGLHTEVVVGDFNNDDRPDVVASNFTEKTVTVLIQEATGKFQVQIPSDLERKDGELIPGDFNGDGNLDISVGDPFTGDLILHYGDGAGGFDLGPKYAFGIRRITGADFNNDGKPDVAATLTGSTKAAVFIGDGAGGFTRTDYEVGSSRVFIDPGDFNGDGILDIAVIGQTESKVIVLPGAGDGTFGARIDMPIGFTSQSFFHPVDLNRDGKTDFVSLVYLGGIRTWINSGDKFVAAGVVNLVEQLDAVTHGDFNGDQIPDLAIGSQLNHTSVYTGTGDGKLNPPIKFATGGSVALATVDLDNDGADDLIVPQFSGEMIVILRNTTARIVSTGSIINCGDAINLTANPDGHKYEWSGPEGTSTTRTVNASTRGKYTVTVSNASGQCKSTNSVVIDGKPAPPVAVVTNPTCELSTGTIKIEIQVNNDIFSFDNGASFQPGNAKSGLSSGQHVVVIQNSDGCNSVAKPFTVAPQPPTPGKPTITPTIHSGQTTLTSTAGHSYIWKRNELVISNANQQTYNAMENGVYSVVIVSEHGCHSESSAPYDVVILGDIADGAIGCYPVPARTHLYLQTSGSLSESRMYSSDGRDVRLTPTRAGDFLVYEVSNLSTGVYLLTFMIDGVTKTFRWVKE